jgi:hypothetical protein
VASIADAATEPLGIGAFGTNGGTGLFSALGRDVEIECLGFEAVGSFPQRLEGGIDLLYLGTGLIYDDEGGRLGKLN